MLYHYNKKTMENSCMGYLEIDVAKFINLIGTVTLSPQGFIVDKVRLENRTSSPKSEIKEPVFICRECDKEVPTEEIGIECHHCYVILKYDKLFFLEGSGGIFCKERLDDLDEADELKIIPLEAVIKDFTAQLVN